MTTLEHLKKELEYATQAVKDLPDWKRVVIERTRQAEEYIGYRRPQSETVNHIECTKTNKSK